MCLSVCACVCLCVRVSVCVCVVYRYNGRDLQGEVRVTTSWLDPTEVRELGISPSPHPHRRNSQSRPNTETNAHSSQDLSHSSVTEACNSETVSQVSSCLSPDGSRSNHSGNLHSRHNSLSSPSQEGGGRGSDAAGERSESRVTSYNRGSREGGRPSRYEASTFTGTQFSNHQQSRVSSEDKGYRSVSGRKRRASSPAQSQSQLAKRTRNQRTDLDERKVNIFSRLGPSSFQQTRNQRVNGNTSSDTQPTHSQQYSGNVGRMSKDNSGRHGRNQRTGSSPTSTRSRGVDRHGNRGERERSRERNGDGNSRRRESERKNNDDRRERESSKRHPDSDSDREKFSHQGVKSEPMDTDEELGVKDGGNHVEKCDGVEREERETICSISWDDTLTTVDEINTPIEGNADVFDDVSSSEAAGVNSVSEGMREGGGGGGSVSDAPDQVQSAGKVSSSEGERVREKEADGGGDSGQTEDESKHETKQEEMKMAENGETPSEQPNVVSHQKEGKIFHDGKMDSRSEVKGNNIEETTPTTAPPTSRDYTERDVTPPLEVLQGLQSPFQPPFLPPLPPFPPFHPHIFPRYTNTQPLPTTTLSFSMTPPPGGMARTVIASPGVWPVHVAPATVSPAHWQQLWMGDQRMISGTTPTTNETQSSETNSPEVDQTVDLGVKPSLLPRETDQPTTSPSSSQEKLDTQTAAASQQTIEKETSSTQTSPHRDGPAPPTSLKISERESSSTQTSPHRDGPAPPTSLKISERESSSTQTSPHRDGPAPPTSLKISERESSSTQTSPHRDGPAPPTSLKISEKQTSSTQTSPHRDEKLSTSAPQTPQKTIEKQTSSTQTPPHVDGITQAAAANPPKTSEKGTSSTQTSPHRDEDTSQHTASQETQCPDIDSEAVDQPDMVGEPKAASSPVKGDFGEGVRAVSGELSEGLRVERKRRVDPKLRLQYKVMMEEFRRHAQMIAVSTKMMIRCVTHTHTHTHTHTLPPSQGQILTIRRYWKTHWRPHYPATPSSY